MYKRISFFILGFWFTAIVVGLIIGMYKIHNASVKNIKQSVELHKSNKEQIQSLKTIHDDLSKKHFELKSKVNKLL